MFDGEKIRKIPDETHADIWITCKSMQEDHELGPVFFLPYDRVLSLIFYEPHSVKWGQLACLYIDKITDEITTLVICLEIFFYYSKTTNTSKCLRGWIPGITLLYQYNRRWPRTDPTAGCSLGIRCKNKVLWVTRVVSICVHLRVWGFLRWELRTTLLHRYNNSHLRYSATERLKTRIFFHSSDRTEDRHNAVAFQLLCIKWLGWVKTCIKEE